MSSEQRAHVRLEAALFLDYIPLPSIEPLCTVTKNISGGGVRFFTDTALNPGGVLQMSLRVPYHEEPLPFTVQVVRSERFTLTTKAESRRHIETSARILEIAPKDHTALTRYIHHAFSTKF